MKQLRHRIAAWLLLLAAFAPVAPALGAPVSEADRADISSRIAEFGAVMRSDQLGRIVEFLPPRLIALIARTAGVPDAEVRSAIATQTIEAFRIVKLVAFEMRMETATAAETPDRSRGYMLVPTEALMEIPDGRRVRSLSQTVALKDDGVWYLVRVDNARLASGLREVYPEFAGVDFPAGTNSPVN